VIGIFGCVLIAAGWIALGAAELLLVCWLFKTSPSEPGMSFLAFIVPLGPPLTAWIYSSIAKLFER